MPVVRPKRATVALHGLQAGIEVRVKGEPASARSMQSATCILVDAKTEW